MPRLPLDLKFIIPPGDSDIRRISHDLIDGATLCRLFLLPKDAPPSKEPHNSSECPGLPDDPVLRYEMIAYRLENIRKFERMVKEGTHEPIRMPNGIIGPQPEGIRDNASN